MQLTGRPCWLARFDKLGISVSKPEQVAELATFEAAREAFNDSIRHFNEAMKCYTAEAWFTEHFEILMDISNLYRQGQRQNTWVAVCP